jgi:hypothetical protein
VIFVFNKCLNELLNINPKNSPAPMKTHAPHHLADRYCSGGDGPVPASPGRAAAVSASRGTGNAHCDCNEETKEYDSDCFKVPRVGAA